MAHYAPTPRVPVGVTVEHDQLMNVLDGDLGAFRADDHRHAVIARALSNRQNIHVSVAQRPENTRGDARLFEHPRADH